MVVSQKDNVTAYKQHLESCFKLLGTDITIHQNCKQIAESAIQLYSKLKSNTDSKNWAFKIDPPWILSLKGKTHEYFFENDEAKLFISGEIVVSDGKFMKYNFFTSIVRTHWAKNKVKYYSCCESKSQEENRVVRRFHFDTSPGMLDILETKAHLQFGGNCIEETAVNEHLGKTLHYCLDNRLDIPRLPFPPVDAILLLDILIRQFQTDIGEDFSGKGDWIELVKSSETFRFRDYYLAVEDYFKQTMSKYKSKTLYQTMCTSDFCF